MASSAADPLEVGQPQPRKKSWSVRNGGDETPLSLFGTGRREGCIAVLILMVLAVTVHAPGLFGGRQRLAVDPVQLGPYPGAAPGIAAPLHREIGVNQSIVLPSLQRAGQSIRQGELPLWNPDSHFGEPFSVTGAPVLYPLFWPLMLNEGWRLLAVVMALHTALACLFMYRFLRLLPVSRYVAFLGAGAYGLGWFLTAQMDRLPAAAAAALAPLALELTWRITISWRRERLGPLLGLAIALLFLTGGTAIASLATALCVLVFAARMPAVERTDRIRSARTAAFAAVVALLMAAPLWLDYLQTSTSCSVAAAPAGGHLKVGGLLGFASPIAFGNLHGTAPASLHDVNPGADALELALYPGALTLFLMLLGLFRPKRTWFGLFWILVAGSGLLLTMDGPVRALVQSWLGWHPGLPGAALFLTHLGAIVLGSVALENFFEAPQARSFAAPLTVALSLLAALLWLAAGYLWPSAGESAVAYLTGAETPAAITAAAVHLRAALFPTVVALSLVSVTFVLWRWVGVLKFKPLLAIVALGEVLLLSTLEPVRTADDPPVTAWADRVPQTPGRLATIAGTALPPGGTAMAAGVATLNTDSDAILDRTARYLRLVDTGIVRHGARVGVRPLPSAGTLLHPLVEMARVTTGVRGGSFRVAGFERFVTPAAPPGASARTLTVATRETPPLARVMFYTKSAASPFEAAGNLMRSAWSLHETVLIEGDDPAFSCKMLGGEATVEVRETRSNSLRLHVAMGKERGYLLVTDAWAPGWHATVDGVDTPVLPADLAFRAVALPEGDHDVVLTYSPWMAWPGLPLLGLGFLLGAALTLVFWKRGPRA